MVYSLTPAAALPCAVSSWSVGTITRSWVGEWEFRHSRVPIFDKWGIWFCKMMITDPWKGKGKSHNPLSYLASAMRHLYDHIMLLASAPSSFVLFALQNHYSHLARCVYIYIYFLFFTFRYFHIVKSEFNKIQNISRQKKLKKTIKQLPVK